MLFNIHYMDDPKLYYKAYGKTVERGTIMSYQEGPEATVDDDIPLACAVLTYPEVVNIWDKNTRLVNHKVDIESRKVVPIRPVPDPIPLNR